MLKRIFAFLLVAFALTFSVDANASSAYYTPRANLAALAALGAASAATAHATIVDSSGGLHDYDWTPGDCSPDGATYVAATGVVTSGAGSGCWVAQTTFLNPTVRTGPFSVANANNFSTCVAWGDSTTQGVGAATPWPTYFGIYSGRSCSNQGAGGQTSNQITMREGGLNGFASATVTGGAVPASGGVAVNFLTGYTPLTNQGPTSLSASIGSVPGTLAVVAPNFTASIAGTTMHVTARVGSNLLAPGQQVFQGVAAQTFIVSQTSGSTGDIGDYVVTPSQTVSSQAMYSANWTFTRTTPGSSTPVSSPTPLAANTGSLNTGLVFLWMGRNDFNNCAGILANYALAVAALNGNTNYRIISILNGSGEGIGTTAYNQITACNASLSAAYPGHYLEERGYEANAIPLPGEFTINCGTGHCTSQALVDAGISPTSQDFIDIAANVPPSSLRQDVLHPNDAGNAVFAQRDVLAAANSVLAMMVGVGTSNPVSPIDVVTSNGQLQIQSNGNVQGGVNGQSFTIAPGSWTNGTLTLDATGAASTRLNVDSGTGGTTFWNGAGTAKSIVTSSGQFGVGTLTPNKMLTIQTPGTTSGEGLIINSAGAFQPTIQLNDTANSVLFQIRIAGGASTLAQIGSPATASGITDIQIGTDVTGSTANAFLDVGRATTSAALNDALTATFNSPLTIGHATSGTAAAGLGAWVPWQLENAAGSQVTFGQVGFGETVATAGSEDGNFLVQSMNAGGLASIVNFTRGKYLFGANTIYDALFAAGGVNSPYFLAPYFADNTARAASLRIEGFGATPGITWVRTGGTVSAATALSNGDNLGSLAFSGYNGSAFSTQSQVLYTASENWVSTTNRGTNSAWQLTPKGSGTLQTVRMDFGDGHFQYVNSTPPAASSCGTSPAVASGSSDAQGVVTEGTVATGCVVTFATAYATSPSCTVTSEAGLPIAYAVTTSAITITNGASALSGTKFHYLCQGNG